MQSDPDAQNSGTFDKLGILVGINNGKPRLFQFDTGSDEFLTPIDSDVAAVSVDATEKPGLYRYGDGSYGYWMRRVRVNSLSYFDPANPASPVATIGGGYVVGQIIDWAYTRNYHDFKERNVSKETIGYNDNEPLFADLDVRKRIQAHQPTDVPPFYGTFAAGDNIAEGIATSALGGHTQTGYVISANANLGNHNTPGCAPCLTLHLTPSLRAQFSALMPWGNLGYDGRQHYFPQSHAPASTLYEGNYNYAISFARGQKKQSVKFKGPVLFDTGTMEFLYVDQTKVLNELRAKGFRIQENDVQRVDFGLYGFKEKRDALHYEDVDFRRLRDEKAGNGLVVGLPFFQANAVMYDLQNRITAFSPYFVTNTNFTTGGECNGRQILNTVTTDVGSQGWLGLAGMVTGVGSFKLEKDTDVRMTGVNSYTGPTYVGEGAFLYLAGPGSIEQSPKVTVDGVLNIEQKGGSLKAWGVHQFSNDTRLQSIEGKGHIYLGTRKLIVTSANGRFSGQIVDYDDVGHNMGGSLVLAGGKLILSGENDYSGQTEVLAGAQLQVDGTISHDVLVFGTLVVKGRILGRTTVAKGGQLLGNGTIMHLTVLDKKGRREEIQN